MKIQRWTLVDDELNIEGARLLTIEEAKAVPMRLRLHDYWWWLQSQGSEDAYAAFVNSNGYIDRYGVGVHYAGVYVRPALIFDETNSNLKIGDNFIFGNKIFTVISSKTAFCTEDIGEHCFRKDWQVKDANDYDKSDVKKFIDNWFEKAKQENK